MLVPAWQNGRETPGPPMNHDVSIEGNTFDDPLGTVIFVGETENLKIRHNVMKSSRTSLDPLAPEIFIYLFNVKDAEIIRNVSDRPSMIVASKTDEDTLVVRDNIHIRGQHG